MNENLYKILKFLYQNSSNYCSGQTLGNNLNISRVAVSKYIKTLKAFGFNIISKEKQGHALYDNADIINEYYIRLKLEEINISLPVIFFETTNSTNLDAKSVAPEMKTGLVVAKTQSAGRGRKERIFSSEDGGLYFSYITTPPNLKPYDAVKTVLLSGIAVCRVLSRYIETFLKWPNDVMIHEKKVCGILSEMICSSDILQHLILGVGININNNANKDVSTACSLKDLNIFTKRVDILAQIIEELINIFNEFYTLGFKPFLNEYKSYSNTLGKKVKIIENEDSFEAYAEDIDENGFLVVRTGQDLLKIVTADVSIRL